jgi:hypothetical protein
VTGRKAENPLYKKDLITQDKDGSFPTKDIDKFMNVWSALTKPEKDASSTKL